MAKKPKDAEQDESKDKKSKGKKKGPRRGGKGESHTDDGASVANHPRASAQVRAAKGWGGLVCFFAAGGLSVAAHDPAFQALLQALIAGIIGCLIGWACSVMIWRQILVAEQRYHADKLRERWEEERLEREEAAAAEAKQTARQK
jgi:hypothetical protein